jgi:hypothetical protein
LRGWELYEVPSRRLQTPHPFRPEAIIDIVMVKVIADTTIQVTMKEL